MGLVLNLNWAVLRLGDMQGLLWLAPPATGTRFWAYDWLLAVWFALAAAAFWLGYGLSLLWPARWGDPTAGLGASVAFTLAPAHYIGFWVAEYARGRRLETLRSRSEVYAYLRPHAALSWTCTVLAAAWWLLA